MKIMRKNLKQFAIVRQQTHNMSTYSKSTFLQTYYSYLKSKSQIEI